MFKGKVAGGPARKYVDKVDMSLDDIIRLNKKEKQINRSHVNTKQSPVKKKGSFQQLRRRGTPAQNGAAMTRGGAAAKLRSGRMAPGRRRGQGVITGLAAKRPPALLRKVAPFNKTPNNQKTKQKQRPFIQRTPAQFRKAEVQRRKQQAPDAHKSQHQISVRRPFQLRRRPLPALQNPRREARQATFMSHRGLKVQAQGQKKPVSRAPSKRTRQWRTSAANNGILTVSIDNPTARSQPEPPTSWSLHPTPAAPSAVAPPSGPAAPAVKKIPKGVPLQFDINSVGKPQTSITLNERFRILKDKRTATTQSSSKGSRFVTVG